MIDALKELKQLKTDMRFGKLAKYSSDFSGSTEVMWDGGRGWGHGTVRGCTFYSGNVMVVINWEQEFICRRIMSPAKRVVDFVCDGISY